MRTKEEIEKKLEEVRKRTAELARKRRSRERKALLEKGVPLKEAIARTS